MRRPLAACVSVCIAFVTFVLGGCLERKEHITIDSSGSVSIELRYKTDSMNELLEGDAMPTPQGGWAVERTTSKDDDGKETIEVLALASFPPKRALPGNHAVRSDADADLYLQFPTSVRIENRRDGTYYHFIRTYHARPHEFIQRLRRQYIENPLKDLGVEPAQWNDEQRMKVVQALANFEREKTLLFAREAAKRALPNLAPDGWLAVRNDVNAFVAQLDLATMAKLLEPKSGEQDLADDTDKRIEAESKKFETSLIEHLRSGMRDLAGCDPSQVNAFLTEFARQKRSWEITEDLNDDKFEITVDMPGQIIASNADQINGGSAVWTFDGQRIHDVELELMVTSRIPK